MTHMFILKCLRFEPITILSFGHCIYVDNKQNYSVILICKLVGKFLFHLSMSNRSLAMSLRHLLTGTPDTYNTDE